LESYNERLSSVIKRSGGLTANSFIMGAMIYRMKSKKDTIPGKVGIDLEKALRYPGSSWDIILVPNDSIKIPKEIQTVTIEGQVFNPSQSQFRPNKSVRYYLSGAGGLNEKALRRGIYLIYANGSIKSTSHILGFNFYPHVLSGSKIFVPEKEKKEKMSESAKVGMYISILSTLSTVGILLYQTFK